MIQLQSAQEEGRLYLVDGRRQTRIIWSLDSGLLELYEKEGSPVLGGGPDSLPLQFFVELDGVPAIRARHRCDNPFLPTALPRAIEATADHANITFDYRTTVPMIPGSPAVTARVSYLYGAWGLMCRLRVLADGYDSLWHGRLRTRFVVLDDQDLAITRLPARSVKEKVLTEDATVMRVFTAAMSGGEADVDIAIGTESRDARHLPDPRRDELAGNRVLRSFADLLLSSYDGAGNIIAGYNIVEPRALHYLGSDRDDVVAEMIAIACRYYRRFRDLRYLAYAQRLAKALLEHIQPDGGLTFGIQVNGLNVDYSDTDADAIDGLLQLHGLTGDKRYLDVAHGLLEFMLPFQDDTGFFWGRYDRRGSVLLFPNQPWFTAYAAIAMQQMRSYVVDPGNLDKRIARAVAWLQDAQLQDGSWPHDTKGSYADYDDLTNTSVAVWGLAALDRLRGTLDYVDAVKRGLRYLATLEQPDRPGQYAGRFTPNVEVLLYDYKLGYALREGVSLHRRVYGDHDERTQQMRRRYGRYLRHIAAIQGKGGMIHGAWGSVFHIPSQTYLTSYDWYERHSSWQQYAFLGWQGKLIELFIEPFV